MYSIFLFFCYLLHQCQLKRVVGKNYNIYRTNSNLFSVYIYFNSGVNTSKCTDWTTTRRTGYKPETDEPIEPQYTATRDFGSKKGGKINKSESKKRSAVKTNNTDVS